MRIDVPDRRLPPPIPMDEQTSLLRDLERRVSEDLSVGQTQEQNVKALNTAVVETFKAYKLEVQYAGPYGIIGPNSEHISPTPDRTGKNGPIEKNPKVSNPLVAWEGNEIGCENIEIDYGVVGWGITNRESYFVRSTQDLEARDKDAHHECRGAEDSSPATEKKDMSEFYIPLKKTTEKGIEVVQEGYDLDVLRPNVFDEEGAREFERIMVSALRTCFPGPVEYEPIEGIHYRRPRNGDSCEVDPKKWANGRDVRETG